MKKTKITYLIGVLFFPILIYGQNLKSELSNELNRIDSIVDLINRTEKNYSEGIAEGPIISKNVSKKNGGWEAYFLYKEQDDNLPLRIKYNQASHKTYQKFEFYYQNQEMIFAKLNVNFYRGKRKNNPIEKKYYFKNSNLISDSNPKLKNYGVEYIKETEKRVRKMIYE
ncbi:hypothetical protein G3567_12900 [Psychroflexus sp. YR1-1]|uniref:Uncharacterized protein n=1 Tax=Psychroflexus aurantiacus TaxID=2709310 RepID=A0A6B3R751_9FLAO|nr:hypothetical protein [Psychroflexus aurantiacus]NEV95035.1 hypothetical protein [Psychroflexus aurantiacus]